MNHYSFSAFCTPCDLILNHELKSVCDDAANEILKNSKQLEEKYSFFTNSSVVWHINNRKNSKVLLDLQTKELLQEVLSLMQQTNYTFDIAYSGTLKQCYELKSLQDMQNKKMNYCNLQAKNVWSLKMTNLFLAIITQK